MGTFEAVEKRVRDKMRKDVLEQVSHTLVHCKQPFGCDPVRDKMRKDVLEQVSHTLVHCKQPFGCDPDCPYYKEAAAFDHPIVYCMPVMAGALDYVRGTLEDEA